MFNEFLFSQVESFSLMLVLMFVLNVLKCSLAAMLTNLLFGLKPTKNKVLYIVVSALIIGASFYSTFRMDGAAFSENDFVSQFLPFVAILLYLNPLKSIWKAVVAAIVADAIGSLKILLLMIMKLSSEEQNAHSLDFIPELFVYVSAAIILFSIFFFVKSRKKDSSFAGKFDALLYLMIIITVTVFIGTMIVLGVEYTRNSKQFILIFLNLPLIIATIGHAMKIFIRSRNSEEKYKEMLDMQIKHYEIMEKKNEELKMFRHDFPKMMHPVLMSLKSGDIAQAEKLIEDFDVSVQSSRAMFSTGNIQLDNVLECAAQKAEKDNISIVLGRGSVFPSSGIDTRDIYTIFPNAIDNAIEACRKIGGHAEIKFDSRIKANAVYVKISNPFNGNIENGLKTTKGDKEHHGYGTKSIKKAASKYGEDNVLFSTEDGIFNLSIKLKYE